MQEYIKIGELDEKIFKKLKIHLITKEVVFTYERIAHVEERRKLYNEVNRVLPSAIYQPDYIYKDWNDRDNTLIFIKNIDEKCKLNIVVKLAINNDKKHSKNSIITMMKIGDKTFNKIKNNKKENLLYEKTGQI